MKRKVTGLLVVLMLGATVGCTGGGQQTAKVSGKVYAGDRVVTAGDIRFHGSKGGMGTGKIQGDGSYTVTDAPVGQCKITVHPAPAMPRASAPPPGVTPITTASSEGVPPNPAKSPPIPDRYQKSESTDLTFTVTSGSNTHDVKMAR